MSLQTWYHIARTPTGWHVHRLDPLKVLERVNALRAADPELTEVDAVVEVHQEVGEAIRTQLGFPPRGRWVHRDGWDSQLTVGEPHGSIMDRQLVEDVDKWPDLGPVPMVGKS
jgi:hypothetical protein